MTETSTPTPATATDGFPAVDRATETDLIEALAYVLDPIAFESLPPDPVLGQLWAQISRQGTARQHAERAIRVGYRLSSGSQS
ncbi:hypothetical protein [Pseudonocardia parietis]|uniref:Uncharacterized protein n=1 Tax=Pseudonocardia parietis TaxID=570936 RepID=A0ABS4W5A5_9PSEU|nr:hypothetical protein [Pseudonocardia parietis]MBP2371361.1 hypothetical protein [Pseudonocardia parietis]